MPITPRQSFMGIDDVLSTEAVAGSIAGCAVAIAVAFLLVVRDAGPLSVGILSVLSGLIVGGITVYWLRRRLDRERTLGLEKQSEWQGLLIWVRVRSPEKEVVTTQNTVVSEDTLEKGREGAYHAEMVDAVRAVKYTIRAFDIHEKELSVANAGPFVVE